MRLRSFLLAGLVAAAALVGTAQAATIRVAVAANFTKVATTLAGNFKAKSGDEVVLSFGATGALYTQITQGAPFEVFLSADDKRTATAIADGYGVAGTDFTYAIGKLALYAPATDVTDGAAVLKTGTFQHVAIADAKTAPYGAAALAALDKLGLTAALSGKLVTGENITQTLQFVESGSAELGFVALSQVVDKPTAHVWLVPQDLYAPIRQNAVLLKVGEQNAAAQAFLDYLKSDEAMAIIAAAGYALQ